MAKLKKKLIKAELEKLCERQKKKIKKLKEIILDHQETINSLEELRINQNFKGYW